MYAMILLATLSLGRDSFSAFGGGSTTESPPLIRTSPLDNRLAWPPFRDKLSAEAATLAERYKGNIPSLRRRFVLKKLTDYAYGLPELKGPFTDAEGSVVDEIVEAACSPYDVKEKLATPQAAPTKSWYDNVPIVAPNGWTYYVRLYAWVNPATGGLLYNVDEQEAAVQNILRGYAPVVPTVPIRTSFFPATVPQSCVT